MFEWDEAKNQANIAKHGVDFAYASRIFEGPVWSWSDDRFDYGEPRQVSIGAIDGVMFLAVVHTPRAGVTRIISARRANRREKESYERETLRRSPQS